LSCCRRLLPTKRLVKFTRQEKPLLITNSRQIDISLHHPDTVDISWILANNKPSKISDIGVFICSWQKYRSPQLKLGSNFYLVFNYFNLQLIAKQRLKQLQVNLYKFDTSGMVFLLKITFEKLIPPSCSHKMFSMLLWEFGGSSASTIQSFYCDLSFTVNTQSPNLPNGYQTN